MKTFEISKFDHKPILIEKAQIEKKNIIKTNLDHWNITVKQPGNVNFLQSIMSQWF